MHRWFWKCGRLFFFYGQITLWAILRDILREPRLFWPLNCPERSEGQFWGQKSRGPLKISRKMAHKVICPKTKIISQIFKICGALVFLCPFATNCPQFYHFKVFLLHFFIVLMMICRENPAKYPILAKNPPKYTTAYIVQQSNCRWHGEPTCKLGLNNEKSIHTLPP